MYIAVLPSAQLVFALIAALAIAVLLLKVQPFVSDSDDLVSTMAQWVLFLQVFAGLLTRVQSDQVKFGNTEGSLNSDALGCVPELSDGAHE